MLILGRLVGESVCIQGGIEVKIARLDGGIVRLGIDAPRGMRVLRKELFEREGGTWERPGCPAEPDRGASSLAERNKVLADALKALVQKAEAELRPGGMISSEVANGYRALALNEGGCWPVSK